MADTTPQTDSWVPVAEAAKDANGAWMVKLGDGWVPATQAAKGPSGEWMANVAGAAPATPSPLPPTEDLPVPPTPQERLKGVGASALGGAVVGALSPEILGAAGKGLQALPYAPAKAVGAAALLASRAAQGQRMMGAVSGAVSGVASESSAQLAESMGVPHVPAQLIGMGVAAALPSEALLNFVRSTAKGSWGLVQRAVGMAKPGEEGVTAAVKQARKLLASEGGTTAPQNAMYAMLQHGVAEDIAAADRAAGHLMSTATKKASTMPQQEGNAAYEMVMQARKEGEALKAAAQARKEALDKVAGQRMKTAGRVLEMSHKELEKVGTAKELSDIGNTLRGKVSAGFQGALANRAAMYQAKKSERDAAVSAQSAAGVTMDKMPEIVELKQDIAKKLLLTQKGMKAAEGKADVTDQGLKAAYSRIYDAVSNRRVQTGVNAEGNPVFQTFKTSFEAIDAVRRKLGDVAFGKEAEGYSALGQSLAKEVYRKLSAAQERFAGPAQRELQKGYEEATEGLVKFQSLGGKRLTAVDRVNPEQFMTDPAALPGTYFKTQQSVRDLKELTGDAVMVEKAAGDYAARMLEGKSAAQVKDWIGKPQNADWIREVPGLKEKLAGYAGKLGQIERVGQGLEGKAAAAKVEGGKVLKGVEGVGEKLTGEARKKVEEAAKAVVKEGFPAEGVRKLLMGGTPEELKTASRYLAGEPGGKAALEGGVRNLLATAGVQKLKPTWEERMLPMLEEGGVVKGAALAKLKSDVERVLRTMEGKEAKKALQMMVEGAMAGAGGAGGAGMVPRRQE